MGARYAVVGMLLLAVGCSGADGASSTAGPVTLPATRTTDELTAHDAEPCPTILPSPEDDPGGHGFGTDMHAEADVHLTPADAGWLCVYNPVDAETTPDGDGTRFRWERLGRPQEMEDDVVVTVEGHIADVVPPAEDERFCNADLGPRYLVVLSKNGDLTGVSVDDYGCRSVLVTDEPFATHPGEGAAPGVRDGGQPIIDALVDAGLVEEIIR